MTILQLSDCTAKMLPLAGGKAANLGEMIRAGLPVPGGFCVTTEAYAEIADAVHIDYDAVCAADARAALCSAPIPHQLASAIKDAYNRLGPAAPVAVRSSATAEDLPNASFAGQQDTYLNVIGEDAVLDAVRRCWASLWTDRATVYRTTNGIDHRWVKLAVVVQKMVDAEISGILFTANPVTGHRRQIVIDASRGLGEAVVSGAVNPDHFVVDAATNRILERRLGDKRFEVRSVEGGGTRHVERNSSAEEACVSDVQIQSLVSLAKQVQAHFGSPQDIEWAIDAAGALYLTQARPITTLFPIPNGETEDARVYFCFSVAQGLYRPLTPMGLSFSRVIASAVAKMFGIHTADPRNGPPAYAEAGERIFVDLTNTLRSRAGRTLFPRMLDVMEARSATILRHMCDDPRFSLTRTSWLPFLRGLVRNAVRFGVPLRILEALRNPAAARARVEQMGASLQRRLAPPPSATPLERLDHIQRVLTEEMVPLFPGILPQVAAGFAMLALAAKLLGDDAQPGDMETVLRGLPHNVTTEMDLELWNLSRTIGTLPDASPEELARRYREGSLPQPLQQELAKFLSRYGHRAVAEIDAGVPRWSEDPAHILGVIANYLRVEDANAAPDTLFERGASTAVERIETLTERARRRGSLRARIVRFALNRVRELGGLREMPKFYLVTAIAALRQQLAALGEELARSGRIANAGDVFFLDLTAVRSAIQGVDMRERVAQQRERYELEMRRRHVPTVLLSDGTEPEVHKTPNASNPGMAGTPASAGCVTGIARVVLNPVGARLEPGEILVAPSTDPGWTPLFLTAGGLVMEMGGANSHGAVVAREYGIPAVVGVAGATLRIVTGQRITIDGASGTITPVPA